MEGSVADRGLRALRGPVGLALLVQLLSGVLMTPQFSFFPIYLAEQLGYSAVMVSTLVSMVRVIGIVTSPMSGTLCDTVGRKWTLVLGNCGYLFAGILFMVRAPGVVVALWLLAGVGFGLRSPAASSYMMGLTGPKRLGLYSGLFTLAITAGAALSSPGAGAILDHWGYPEFGAALVAVTLLTMVLTTRLPNLQEPHRAQRHSFAGSFAGYGALLSRPIVRVLGWLRFLPTCFYGMSTVLIPIAINRLAGNKTSVALYSAISQVAATLTQLLSGWAADRWGRRWPTLLSFVLLIASSLGLGLFAEHLWSYYVFGTLGTSAAWSLSALLPCLVSDAAPPAEHSRVLGLLMLVWNVAMIAGSMLGGSLVEIATGLPYVVVAVFNVAAIFLAFMFFRLQRTQPCGADRNRA